MTIMYVNREINVVVDNFLANNDARQISFFIFFNNFPSLPYYSS